MVLNQFHSEVQASPEAHFQITTSLCMNLNKKTKSELNAVCNDKLFNSISVAVAFMKRLHSNEPRSIKTAVDCLLLNLYGVSAL
jgi:hypothetical protein